MKGKSFLGYNTFKGRLLFAIVFSIFIFIGIKIIDTRSLHDFNLNFRNAAVGKYLDLMSIFVFVYGILFMFYSSLGVYDAITFMTSEKAYSSRIFFLLMIVLGILQAFMGIDTVGRLFEMNGLLVSRNSNVYSGMYLFASAIKCVIYSLVMYVIRYLSGYVMRIKHDRMMDKNEDLRARQKQLKDFLRED